MTTPYNRHMAEDRRLCILTILSNVGGKANENVLAHSLDLLGHTRLSQSVVRDDLQYLENRNLLKVEWVAELQICSITTRGAEVQKGSQQVEGVKTPSIGV